MESVNVGLIGLGWMGQLHLKYLSGIDGCRIQAVCDTDPERVKAMAKQYGADGYLDYHELIEDDKVDVVYIAAPQFCHYEMAKAVMETGKHLLCEKPLALTREEVNELRRMARNYPGKVIIDFPERFSVSTEEAMEEIRAGKLGKIQFMRGNFRFSMKEHANIHGSCVFDKSKGGGLILESSVHLWDAVRYMTGQEVTAVGAVAHHHPEMNFEDSFFCIAYLSDGAIASIDMNGWMPKESDTDKRFEIVGDSGAVYLDEFRNYLTIKSEKGIENNPGMLTEGMTHKDVMWHSSIAGGVKRLDEYFIRCIQKNEVPMIGIEDAARACEITWAVYEALESGKMETVKYGTEEE